MTSSFSIPFCLKSLFKVILCFVNKFSKSFNEIVVRLSGILDNDSVVADLTELSKDSFEYLIFSLSA